MPVPRVAFADDRGCLIVGHCLDGLRSLPDESVDCVVTSPPYWGLRDYGDPGQEWPEVTYSPMPGYEVTIPAMVAPLGQEPEPAAFVGHLVLVFREVMRVLKPSGTLWLNLGDSYAATGKSGGGRQGERWATAGMAVTGPKGGKWSPAPSGLKAKDLCGIPWLAAFALRSDGWYLRSEIIWAKPNPMPESVTDRPTKAHEQMFLLTKSSRYFYDADAVREVVITRRAPGAQNIDYADRCDGTQHRSGVGFGLPAHGRNVRDVWTVASHNYKGAHFATMPPGLVDPAIKAGCPAEGVVLDPFFGSGTVAEVAEGLGRRWIGTEQSDPYAVLAIERVTGARERRASVKMRKAPTLKRIRVEDWPSVVADEARFWAEVHDTVQAEGEDGTAPTWALAECRPYVPVEQEHVAESLYLAVYAAERARLSARARKSQATAFV